MTRAAAVPSVLPIAVAAFAIALFVGMDAAMKSVTIAIGVYNAMLWRALLGLAASGAIWTALRPSRPTPEALRVHVIRGVVSTFMALAWFWGIARMPLAEAIALSFIAPLIALFLAAWLLGERIGRPAIMGSLLGFAGVLVIVATRARASMEGEALADAAAILVSAVLYAYNIVLMRRQALVALPTEITFFQNLVVSGMLLAAAPFLAIAPPAEQWPGIATAAALTLGSALLFAWAYRRAEAQALAPVEYTAIVWGALFGAIVFDEAVAAETVVGAVLIVAGCLLAARPGAPVQSPAEAAT